MSKSTKPKTNKNDEKSVEERLAKIEKDLYYYKILNPTTEDVENAYQDMNDAVCDLQDAVDSIEDDIVKIKDRQQTLSEILTKATLAKKQKHKG